MFKIHLIQSPLQSRKKFKQLFMRVFCCKGKDVMDEISDSPGSLLSSTINQSEILKENIYFGMKKF